MTAPQVSAPGNPAPGQGPFPNQLQSFALAAEVSGTHGGQLSAGVLPQDDQLASLVKDSSLNGQSIGVLPS